MIGPSDPVDELFEYAYSHFFGKYRGVVVDNVDATDRGRLQVKVPAVLGDEAVWALPCVPYAGAGVGFYVLPEPKTAVWVEFEAGDPSFPVWTGCFWADNELPDTGGPTVKILRTQKATLRVDDDAGEVLLSDDRESGLRLDDKATLEAAAGGGTARHAVGGTGVRSESGGGGTVELDGANVALNGDALKVS